MYNRSVCFAAVVAALVVSAGLAGTAEAGTGEASAPRTIPNMSMAGPNDPVLGNPITAATLPIILDPKNWDAHGMRVDFMRKVMEAATKVPGWSIAVISNAHSTNGKCFHKHYEAPQPVGTRGVEAYYARPGMGCAIFHNGDGGWTNWAYGGQWIVTKYGSGTGLAIDANTPPPGVRTWGVSSTSAGR